MAEECCSRESLFFLSVHSWIGTIRIFSSWRMGHSAGRLEGGDFQRYLDYDKRSLPSC